MGPACWNWSRFGIVSTEQNDGTAIGFAAETGILTAQKLRQAEDEKDIVEQGRLERIGVIAGLALQVK
jgi:hypothetical protein